MHGVRVNEYGQHQVYVTPDGIKQVDVGPPFETPLGAVALAKSLDEIPTDIVTVDEQLKQEDWG